MKPYSQASRVTRKPILGFPTRSDANRVVQPQQMARVLRSQIQCMSYVAKTNKNKFKSKENIHKKDSIWAILRFQL